MSRNLEPYQLIERSIIKKYRKELWNPFTYALKKYELIQEGLTSKLVRLPEEVREKFRGALNRIVNEGASGLICLIL